MNNPKIVVMGKNKIAWECSKFLLEQKENIVGVVVGGKAWQESLETFAKENNLPYWNFEKINSPEAVQKLKELEPDFIFSFQFDQILKKQVIEIPNKGCINLHFAFLPNYRGCHTIAKAMLNKEQFHGVTLHYMVEGIDSGNIISQKKVKIEKQWTARNLYDKLTEEGVNLFKETWPLLKEEKIEPKTQGKNFSYYDQNSVNYKELAKLDLNKFDSWQIKAMIFPPFQYPYFELDGLKFFITKVEKKKE